MSYVAIARKWRPKTFAEISGQQHVTRTLENAILQDRVHHAYLFCGPRGVGKTTSARALSRSLNCEQGPTVSPCGMCVNCREILQGNSPDVIEIDGASNNSVENIRNLRESVQFLPTHGKKKIYIIDEVHMLSKGAFNALLKTLEEPPPHIIFMFATTEPQKVPETILSRVQRFEFKRITTQTVMDKLSEISLAEGFEIEEAGLRLIARAGEGSMRDSQSLLDQVISFASSNQEPTSDTNDQNQNKIKTEEVTLALGMIDRGLLYQMFEGMLNQTPELCFEAIQKVYSYGYDLTEFSTELLELFRNATLFTLSPTTTKFIDLPPEEASLLKELASKNTPDVFVRAFDIVLETHEYIARSPRPKLVMEMMVAKLMSIRSVVPIDALLQHVRSLKDQVAPPNQTISPQKKKTILNDGVSKLGKSPEKKQTTNQELQTRNTATNFNPKTISQISPSQSIDSKVNDEDQKKEKNTNREKHTKEKLHTENHKDQSDTTPTQEIRDKSKESFDSNTLSNTNPKKHTTKIKQTTPQRSVARTKVSKIQSIYGSKKAEKEAEKYIRIFKKIQKQILKLDIELHIWAYRVGYINFENGILYLAAPQDFSLHRLTKTANNSEILSLYKKHFKGLDSIDIKERTGILPETLNEYEDRKLKEAKILQRQNIEQDEQIQGILHTLNAHIGQIILSNDFSVK